MVTLRLIYPQWQGGNNPLYPLGAELLNWLAPAADGPVRRVAVENFHADDHPQDGVSHRDAIVEQLRAARRIVDEVTPDRIAVIGGDCLVEQAPFSYLNELYEGKLGVLWIDAHPDVKTTEDFTNAHTMVLGNLLGGGDPEMAAEVPVKIASNRVMYAGLREEGLTEQERSVIDERGLRVASPAALEATSEPVLRWIAEEGIAHLAIHLDLDVLDPRQFRSVLFAEPEPEIDWLAMYPAGQMTFGQVQRLCTDVAAATDVVAMGIAEHLPWDAWNLQSMLAGLPVIGPTDTPIHGNRSI